MLCRFGLLKRSSCRLPKAVPPKPTCVPAVDKAAYAADNIRVLRQELADIRRRGLAMSIGDWDNIEEILEEIEKQKRSVVGHDVLEEWCVSNPSDPECLVYDC